MYFNTYICMCVCWAQNSVRVDHSGPKERDRERQRERKRERQRDRQTEIETEIS